MRSRQEISSKIEGAVCIQPPSVVKNPQLPSLETENRTNFLIVIYIQCENIHWNQCPCFYVDAGVL